jgi:peptidoglycan-associated lipoprotein
MKLNQIAKPLALTLALSLAALGCKSTKGVITPLGDKTGAAGQDQNANLGDAGKLDSTPGVAGNTGLEGISQGPGHPNWIPHRDTFQSDTVHFSYDSSNIRPAEKSKVAAVGDYLKSNLSEAVLIEGHCDERGTDEYNRALGERRALALRETLVKLGIEATRVDTISYGKDRPVDTGSSEASHSKNRRGEFVLLTPPNK